MSLVPTVAFSERINERQHLAVPIRSGLVFVFNPPFGAKERVRAVHAQVHTHSWDGRLSPGCHGSDALEWGYLPIFAELSSPCVVVHNNCRGVIGLRVL